MLLRAKGGDKAAFGWIVGEYQSMIFSVALHFFRNRATAEEIAQDVFLDLYRNLESLESGAHLCAWLRRDTANRCIDRSRKKSYRMEMAQLEDVHTGQESSQPDFLAYAQVRAQVAELPEDQRAVVILRFQEEMMPSEIAETLELPINTVKSRLHRALASLRGRIELKRGQPA